MTSPLTAKEVEELIYEREDEPVAFVFDPNLHAAVLSLTNGVVMPPEKHPSVESPTLEGIELRRDPSLRTYASGVQGVGLVFYEWDGLKRYYELPEYARPVYAFTRPGEPVEKVSPFSQRFVRGDTKTLVWVENDDSE